MKVGRCCLIALGWWVSDLRHGFCQPDRAGNHQFFSAGQTGRRDESDPILSAVNHRVTWNYLKMLYECGRPGQFRGMGLPVEILYGEKTFSAVRRSVQEWKEAWPQARVKELAGVGHLPISEGTREVADAVFSNGKLQQ